MSASAVAECVVPASGAVPARSYRIAVLSYGLPRSGAKRGGIEQVAHSVARALVHRGHRVTVFTYDPAPSDADYDVRALPCRRFAMTWLGRRLTMGYLGNLLLSAASYAEFEVIIAHGDSLLLPMHRKPVIRVMHGCALEEAQSATSIGRAVLQAGVYVQELLTAALQRGTVGVSANSRRLNPFVRRVIPNGVDRSLFVPDPSARTQQPSILFVGALRGRKRGSRLLESFEREIRPAFPTAELHMVAEPGPPTAGVTYHTGIATEALVRLYQQSWIYASPSTYEGFGLPYLEAMACGIPVVATPNPGSREVLDHGRCGALVQNAQFGAEIIRLLKDPERRRRLSECGLARAADYDLGTSVLAYEALIAELVAE
jgi:phosphatidylinositol alpha-mannosyltransferase